MSTKLDLSSYHTHPGIPLILGLSSMSKHRAAIWVSKAKTLKGRVDILDPFRAPLRQLRKELDMAGVHGRMYRASTGGRWGKSAKIVMV